MTNHKINNPKELHKLIVNFQNQKAIKSPGEKAFMITAFRDYVIRNHMNVLASSLTKYNNPVDTFAYNFNLAIERRTFVEDVLTDKLFPKGKKAKCIIFYLKPEDKIESYLYRVIENEALTLIKKNKSKLETVSVDDVGDPSDIEIEETEVSDLEKIFPLIYNKEEALANPHLFICNRIAGNTAMKLLPENLIEKNRILEWREAVID